MDVPGPRLDERRADLLPAPSESAAGWPGGGPADSAAASDPAGADGRLIGGRYRLATAIGQGSMGRVWRARDELLGRDVAIKEVKLPPELNAAGQDALRQRMLREARSAARLSHPAVATVHDVVEDLGRPWIVMELVHGRPLDRVIESDGPLSPKAVAQIGQQLLAALAAAHAVGVLHRDVKPSNVLLTRAGRAVLTDFGVAAIDGDASLTQSGMVAGTPAFCSPERIRGEAATPAADLWSLGATLYAAVEGQGPYDQRGGTTATIAAIVTDDPQPPAAAGPVAGVITAFLSRDPAARPSAAAAMRMLEKAAGAPAETHRRRKPRARRMPRRSRPAVAALAFLRKPRARRMRWRWRPRPVVAGLACIAIALPISIWALVHAAAQHTAGTPRSLQSVPTGPSTLARPDKSHAAKPDKPITSAVPHTGNAGRPLVPPVRHSSSPSPSSTPSHHTSPSTEPFRISGSVSCQSGNAVEGVWVEAKKGPGYAPWWPEANNDAAATFRYRLPEEERYSLHVGCGGTKASWQVANYSVTVTTAVNNFACDDVPGEPKYGTCRTI